MRNLGAWTAIAAGLAVTIAVFALRSTESPGADSEATRFVAREERPSELSSELDSPSEDSLRQSAIEPTGLPSLLRAPDARLLVTVVSSADRVPMSGVRVVVHDRDRSFEQLAASDPTDASGRTELPVPSGLTLLLVADDHVCNTGTALNQITPLRPGERREFRFVLHPGDDTRVFVRVTACGTGEPIQGAIVQACRASDALSDGEPRHVDVVLHEVETDREGRCELEYPTGRDVYLRVRADGMGTVGAKLESDVTTSSSPQSVCLESGASLRISVNDPAGEPVRDALVRLSSAQAARDAVTRAWYERNVPPGLELSATTDSNGVVRFTDLPPGVPVLAYKFVGDRTDALEDALVWLGPGEERELRWTLGVGCRIEGIVTDDASKPLADVAIALHRPTEHVGDALANERASVAKADAQGRFVFEAVAPGTWTLELSQSHQAPRPELLALAVTPMTIQIGANDRSREIAMRVHRGLFIEGRVYGTNGSPDRIDVRAREELDRWESRTLSTSDGAFTLGPLIPGRYELTAEGSPTRVWVKAGEKGVELRLNTGGSLDIRVIDASSREECEATVTITRRVEESNESRTLHYPWFDDSQTRGLASGYYDITAITADRRYGEVRDVIVDDGRITKDVVVAVAPCGELRLRCDAPYRSGTVQVMHEGRVMRTATLEPGVDLSIVFPSGRTTVRFVGQGAAGVSEQTFELAPGENRLVVFGE